jgi:signal transduction histidine kinase
MTVAHRAPDPAARLRALPGDRTPGGAPEPLAGVQSRFVTAATRRVARLLREESKDNADSEVVSALLAAIALAVDRRHPDYVSMLLPQPSPELGQRLVELLRVELLRGWASDRASDPAPTTVLDAISALEQVRQALDRSAGAPEERLPTGADALDLFVEVVHDLRSPLTSILCLADTLQRERSGEVNKLQHRQLGLIYSAALGLSGLVSDALELARGGGDLVEDQPVPLSLSALVEDVTNITRPMAEEKGLRMGVASIDPDRRLGHPVALGRVLLNLTTNALKFTDQGHVEIACSAQGDATVRFAVSDTGPGINPIALASLYQPFRRARGRSGFHFSGTGLGLAICRKLVRTMGSDLQLDTGSWGTRFFFDLDLPPIVAR